MSLTVVTLRNSDLGLPKGPEVLSLHDGGVYDNLGLEWFQRWDARRRPPEALNPPFKIIVNASGALDRTPRRYSARKALSRDMSIQYAQTLNLRVSWQIDRLLHPPAGSAERGVYIGTKGDAGEQGFAAVVHDPTYGLFQVFQQQTPMSEAQLEAWAQECNTCTVQKVAVVGTQHFLILSSPGHGLAISWLTGSMLHTIMGPEQTFSETDALNLATNTPASGG